MAIRYLLTENNNPWGVKILDNGTPAYEHIIHFPNTLIRDQFIGDNLFDGGVTWKSQVKIEKQHGDDVYDANNIEFDIYIGDYPNETTDSLLNKNYVVTYNEEGEVYAFWAVQGTTYEDNHNIIRYQGVRDWMMELDVTKIFDPNKQVVINRAHIPDTITKVGKQVWNISQDSENSIVEPIENFNEENFVRVSERDFATPNLQSKFTGTKDRYRQFIEKIEKGFSMYIFQPSIEQNGNLKRVYITSIYDEQWNLYNINQSSSTTAQQQKLAMYLRFGATEEVAPYSVMLVPNSDDVVFKKSALMGTQNINNSDFKTIFNGSPQLLKISPLPYFPINITSISVISYNTTTSKYEIELYDKYATNQPRTPIYNEFEVEMSFFGSSSYWYIGAMKHMINGIDITSDSVEINTASDYDTSPSSSFNYNNIAKMHKFPYKQVYAKNVSGSRFNLYQQLVDNSYQWQLGFTYAPDVWHLILGIKDVDNTNGIYNSSFQYGIRLDDIAPFTMPQESSRYLDYITANQSQVNQQFRRFGWNIGLGVANATAGAIGGGFAIGGIIKNNNRLSAIKERDVNASFSDRGRNSIGWREDFQNNRWTWNRNVAENDFNLNNPQQSLGAIATSLIGNTILGGGQTIVNSVMDIEQQKAMLSDLKRNPSSVSGNGGDVLGILPRTTMKPIEYTDELWPELRDSVAQYFQMFGSQLNNKFRNINDYLDTRYHFNYIQTQDLYQNFLPQINNGAKNLISNSFVNGCWIWHYRTASDWKGVKNFMINNPQRNTTLKEEFDNS